MLLGIFAMTCVRFRCPLLERPLMMTGDRSKTVKWGGREVPGYQATPETRLQWKEVTR